MKNFSDISKDEGEILGPGTDLVISLVAVLILLLALYSKSSQSKISELEIALNSNTELTEQLINYKKEIAELKETISEIQQRNMQLKEQDIVLGKIRESQLMIIHKIAEKYNTEPNEVRKNHFEIPIRLMDNSQDIIQIKNDATLQRISFGESILFEEARAILKFGGKEILNNTAVVFKDQLALIKEIQVQGHADADQKSLRSKNDNLELAARRAISIVRFFRDDHRVQIDPAKYVMYASSFGYYMPVERNYQDENWDVIRIEKVNKGNLGDKNRRIEVVLNYKEI